MTRIHRRRPRAAAVHGILLGIVLGGCQTTPPGPDAATHIERVLESAIADNRSVPEPPPPAVRTALLPPVTIPAAAAPAPRFEISVREAPAQQFFMGLVEGTPNNMVVHPEVAGTITLTLKNVTLDDVMDTVRSVYGYEYRRTRLGYEVLPARLKTEIYQIDVLNVLRSGSSETRVSSGQVSQSDDGVAVTDAGVLQDGRSSRVSGTQISTLQPETTFWRELQGSVQAIIGAAQGRSVVVNPQSGVIVVRAMPHELREVEAFITTVQEIATRQVILEAKIIEVELNDQYRQGINWAALVEVGGNPVTVGQTGGGSSLDNGTSEIAGASGVLDPAALMPIVGTAASAFGGVFTLALALNDFTAFIELLRSQGNVHVLSSPRISTMNNQKAVIKVGTDEFFVTDVSNTTVTGASTTTIPSVELTPFFSGIALDVTPQISEDGAVTLHVHPAISEVQDQQKTFAIGGISQTLPLALSSVRESDSIVKARSGQVIVIGGLMTDRLDNGRAGTPGLMGLPGVGAAFRHSNDTVRKSELVILMRPLVVRGAEQWAGVMRRSLERLQTMHGSAAAGNGR